MVNTLDKKSLANIIKILGDENEAKKIANNIAKHREKNPIRNSYELSKIISNAKKNKKYKKNPATKTFQAIRITVNDEMSALSTALEQAVSLLGQGGRLVVISYHSLEDRIVKNFIRKQASDCICPPGTPVCRCDHLATMRAITRRPLIPTEAEVASNPRARSAKLRAAERI